MTAIEILDDDNFLGAENSFNLFTCQKDRCVEISFGKLLLHSAQWRKKADELMWDLYSVETRPDVIAPADWA